MNDELNPQEIWSAKLKHSISILLTEVRQNSTNLLLPETIELIPREYRELPLHGHPISWILYGSIGIKSFAIGIMTSQNPEDDLTEKHMIPPILSKSLAIAGPEYVFSQEAIVVIPSGLTLGDSENKWLNRWLDERSYMHRSRIEEGASISDLAARLIQVVFCPWQSVKMLKNIDNNYNHSPLEEEKEEV